MIEWDEITYKPTREQEWVVGHKTGIQWLVTRWGHIQHISRAGEQEGIAYCGRKRLLWSEFNDGPVSAAGVCESCAKSYYSAALRIVL